MNSYTPSLAELEIRLAKLERQNRFWKRLGLLFLLIAGSGFLLAQAPRKPLSAAPTQAVQAATYDTLVVHRLELRDKAGKLRGVWTVEAGQPFLALYDAAGNPRAILIVGTDGPDLRLYDPAGNTRAMLGATTDGPLLALSDAAGNSHAGLFVRAAGPGLVLSDAAGKLRASLAVDADGSRLALTDTAGKTGAGLAVTADGPGLALTDSAGKPRAGLTEDNFFVTDAQGFKAVVGVIQTETIKTGESHKTSAAAVTLFGKDDKVIWHAP
ncbi:MAG: hypothetical protein MUP80_05970 [Acidobacteriia bacterium]|nr:hypothetical protein [Terriglobia bacterium]